MIRRLFAVSFVVLWAVVLWAGGAIAADQAQSSSTGITGLFLTTKYPGLTVRAGETTTHLPEALERLVECDLALGLTREAKDNAAVLGYNYPGSRWYKEAYALITSGGAPAEARDGWFGRMVSGVF